MRRKLLSEVDFEQFFLNNRKWMKVLLSTYPDQPELWEVIFKLRFGCLPEPPAEESCRVRRGSTDPRWDQLLHTENTLRTVRSLRTRWLKRTDL